MNEGRRERPELDQPAILFTDRTAKRHGIDYSEGGYRDLGYGDDLSAGRDEGDGRRQVDVPPMAPSRVLTGKGPRTYRRRDDTIADELYVRLVRDPRIDASDLDFGVEQGDVVLRGFVADRAQKRLAEDLAWEIQGVGDVRNELKVIDPAAAYDYGDPRD